MPAVTVRALSQAITQLMPEIIRGVQLDFFVRKGVTQTQFLMLAAIHAYGRCPMSRLARSLHVRLPTATGIIDRLVRDGLARRVPHAEDRRQVLVALTPKGQTFIREFQAVVGRRWEVVLHALTVSERAALHGVVEKLRHQLQAARDHE